LVAACGAPPASALLVLCYTQREHAPQRRSVLLKCSLGQTNDVCVVFTVEALCTFCRGQLAQCKDSHCLAVHCSVLRLSCRKLVGQLAELSSRRVEQHALSVYTLARAPPHPRTVPWSPRSHPRLPAQRFFLTALSTDIWNMFTPNYLSCCDYISGHESDSGVCLAVPTAAGRALRHT
jgi:hypothetical protein